MKRLAFLSPLPPAPTGIADYAADVLALLAGRYQVDAYHDQEALDRDRLPVSVSIHRAAGFLPRHRERPYDLAVYQMGNGLDHAFVYEPLARVPGLLVLHDLVLHHARARTFLDAPEVRAYARDPSSASLRDAALQRIAPYRDEVAYSYPRQAESLVEAHLATVGDLLPYAYPLFRIPVEASRAVAVHNAFMADAIRAEVPEARVVCVPMPVEATPVAPEAVAALRARHGLSPGDLVVGSFGLLTREKQVDTIARAVARAAEAVPGLRLLLVGPVPEPDRLPRLLEALGVHHRTIVTGRVPFPELPAYMQLADVVVHLRYPTARETSAALLRVLAQGRPAIVSDLENLAGIPDDAVVRADVTDEEGDVTRAILRLASRPDHRARLGRAAADFVRREHALPRCLAGYEAAIEAALTAPAPRHRDWPAHWPRP